MNWEQKLYACKSLAPVALEMRAPGDWYVSHRIGVCSGPVEASIFGNGRSPEEAVEDHWKKIMSVNFPQAIRVGNRYFRWALFMWEEVEKPQ